MDPNSIMAPVSVLALSFPLVMALITGLYKYKSFPVLCSYYVLMIFDNCIGEGYLPVPQKFSHYSAVISNMLDPLLMLGFLTYFSRTPLIRKRILQLMTSLAIFEILAVAFFGFNDNGLAVALGPGLGAVLLLSIYFFQHQVKLSVMKGKAIGKAIMIAALTFMYGCYFISYLMYFVFKSPDIVYSYLILYFINLVSSLTMGIGILTEKGRVRKLKELLTARKEIAEIYATISFQPAKQNVLSFLRKKLQS